MRELLFVKQPFANHNGGEVLTGPDGMLYIGLGDGGSAGDPMDNGQNNGDAARQDPAHRPEGERDGRRTRSRPTTRSSSKPNARPEIWQCGLRNPWRFSFDRATGDMWIGDVGQNAYEEIDFAKAGAAASTSAGVNAKGRTSTRATGRPGAVDPVYEYSHDDGGVAVTGGYVYRGKRIPDLVGAYLFADEVARPHHRAPAAERAGRAAAASSTP